MPFPMLNMRGPNGYMTEYGKESWVKILFPPPKILNPSQKLYRQT